MFDTNGESLLLLGVVLEEGIGSGIRNGHSAEPTASATSGVATSMNSWLDVGDSSQQQTSKSNGCSNSSDDRFSPN